MANGNTLVRRKLIQKIAGVNRRVRKGKLSYESAESPRKALESALDRQWEIRKLCILAATTPPPRCNEYKAQVAPFYR